MELFTWEIWYNTNIEHIDNQHKQLVKFLNSLYDAMKQGKGFEIMSEILNGLTEYTIQHFKTEEELMIKYKYPDYENHKKEHGELIEEVSIFKSDFDQKKRSLSFEVADYLKSWLKDHIQGTDKKLGKFLLGQMK